MAIKHSQWSESTMYFPQVVLHWYEANKRALPWRNSKEPYIVWLSEVILQQTRVSQGMPYFQKILAAFPTVHKMAACDEEVLLRLWQGLGYYSRARNMLETARFVSKELKGFFPTNAKELQKLKGVGAYTAAAIASISYGERIAVVDGNVYRVLARFFGIELDIVSTNGKKHFDGLANRLVPEKDPGNYNQAIMEFGALQCVPENPDCGNCVLQKACVAFDHKLVEILPVKAKKRGKKVRYFNYLLFFDNEGNVFMKKRKNTDIWGGLYEMPLFESTGAGLSNTGLEAVFETKHELTHQTLYIRIFMRPVSVKKDILSLFDFGDAESFSLKEIEGLPKPVVMANFFGAEFFSNLLQIKDQWQE